MTCPDLFPPPPHTIFPQYSHTLTTLTLTTRSVIEGDSSNQKEKPAYGADTLRLWVSGVDYRYYYY